MSASQRCDQCQAVNTATAQWCTQCYTPFGSVKGPAAPSAPAPSAPAPSAPAPSAPATNPTAAPSAPAPGPAPGSPASAPAPSPGSAPRQSPAPSQKSVPNPDSLTDTQIAAMLSQGRLGEPIAEPSPQVDAPGIADGATWTCRSCESANPLEVDVCHACGISIFDGFGGADDAVPNLTLNEATLWALIPGAGHMKMGHALWGLIILVAVVTLWIFGVWLGVSDSLGTGLVFMAVALGLLAVSVVDARTLASGGSRLILAPRTLSIVFGAAIVGIMATVWLRAVA